jgi:TonB family protein
MTPHDVLSESPVARSSRAGSGWVEGFVRRAIQHAAHKAPAALSERLEEEWLADLATRERTMARVRFALGCCWATRVIAHELGAPLRAPAATANKAAAVCTQTGPAFFSRRTTVSVLIISLHTLVIYGLASGVAHQVFEAVPDHLQVSFTKADPSYRPPRPLDVKVDPLHFTISPPDRIPDIDMTPVTITNVGVQPPQLASSSSSATRVVNVVMGGPAPGFPNTADYYPDAARRLGEKGSAMIQVCVDGTGRLTADPTIAQSSGSARLDAGALRLARAGSGHYRATTEDGSPVSGCYAFRVRFALRD